MALSSYTPELMAVYKAYAASLGPTPKPGYTIVHERHAWIQVPPGHLPIKIAQFSRGERSDGHSRLHHWAIFIPTSTRRGVGNFYEIGGSLQSGYFTQHVINKRHPKWDRDEKGTHLVGWVAPDHLAALETRIALISIHQGRPDWNCQTWVVEALKGLNQPHMYAVQMDHAQWYQQMALVEKAWEVGDEA
ncbi:hypothetical protein V8E55_006833 [Tylopilus felleus]